MLNLKCRDIAEKEAMEMLQIYMRNIIDNGGHGKLQVKVYEGKMLLEGGPSIMVRVKPG